MSARNRPIALLVLLLLVACSRTAEPSPPAATLGAAPSATPAPSEPTTESEAPDPYAIPADPKDIDEAYVERVLEALMVSISKAARVVAREGKLTEAAEEELRATHRESRGSSIIEVFEAALQQAPGGQVFDPNATPARMNVRRVLSAHKSCVFALVLQDTSGLVRQDIKPFLAYYQLGTKTGREDPKGLNPTPWVVEADAEPRKDGKEYANPCD